MADLTGRSFDVLDTSWEKAIDLFNQNFRLGSQLGQQDKQFQQSRRDRLKKEEADRKIGEKRYQDKLDKEAYQRYESDRSFIAGEKGREEAKEYRKTERAYQRGRDTQSDKFREADDKRQEERNKILDENAQKSFELQRQRFMFDMTKYAGANALKQQQTAYDIQNYKLAEDLHNMEIGDAEMQHRTVQGILNQRNNLDLINRQERINADKEGRDAKYYIGYDHGTGVPIPYTEEGVIRTFDREDQLEFFANRKNDYVHNPVTNPNAKSPFQNMTSAQLKDISGKLSTKMIEASNKQLQDKYKFLRSTGVDPDDYKGNQIGPNEVGMTTLLQFKTKESMESMSNNQRKSLLENINAVGREAFIKEMIQRKASRQQVEFINQLLESVSQYTPETLMGQRSEASKRNPKIGYDKYLKREFGIEPE